MAATVKTLPGDFVPFSLLSVCGNTMTNGKAPFAFGDTVPLLVGAGERVKIWLSAPKDRAGQHWMDLIVAGRAIHPEVKVLYSEDSSEVSVQWRRVPMIEIKKDSLKAARVTFLDLRPVGLNIFGDSQSLQLGPHRLVRNSFDNVGFMAMLG
jgi:hypothetical protein